MMMNHPAAAVCDHWHWSEWCSTSSSSQASHQPLNFTVCTKYTFLTFHLFHLIFRITKNTFQLTIYLLFWIQIAQERWDASCSRWDPCYEQCARCPAALGRTEESWYLVRGWVVGDLAPPLVLVLFTWLPWNWPTIEDNKCHIRGKKIFNKILRVWCPQMTGSRQ